MVRHTRTQDAGYRIKDTEVRVLGIRYKLQGSRVRKRFIADIQKA
jgi:hypothetical protein